MKYYLVTKYNECTMRGSYGHQDCIYQAVSFATKEAAKKGMVERINQSDDDVSEFTEGDYSFDFGDGYYVLLNKSELLNCNLQPNLQHRNLGACDKLHLKAWGLI